MISSIRALFQSDLAKKCSNCKNNSLKSNFHEQNLSGTAHILNVYSVGEYIMMKFKKKPEIIKLKIEIEQIVVL